MEITTANNETVAVVNSLCFEGVLRIFFFKGVEIFDQEKASNSALLDK